jgi:quercetin dioxygenase-like cupin family protein
MRLQLAKQCREQIETWSDKGGQDMAKAGDELVNPVTGLRTVFRKSAQDTSGELVQVDWIGEPDWTTGPDHVHPRQEERFEVLSGKLSLRVEGVERVYSAGDVIVAPAGVPHAAWNAGDDEVHVLVDFRPALRTETAFETLAGLARDGKTNGAGPLGTRCSWRSSCATLRMR